MKSLEPCLPQNRHSSVFTVIGSAREENGLRNNMKRKISGGRLGWALFPRPPSQFPSPFQVEEGWTGWAVQRPPSRAWSLCPHKARGATGCYAESEFPVRPNSRSPRGLGKASLSKIPGAWHGSQSPLTPLPRALRTLSRIRGFLPQCRSQEGSR